MDGLKTSLITAAYPRGGGDHLKSDILGVRKDEIPNSRAMDKYKSFISLKNDPQTTKIKNMAAKFDAPKRVEVKELELSLLKMVEFSELAN